MEDTEIAACVESALRRQVSPARIEPLGGRQGLLVCRVRLAGGDSCVFKVVREARRAEILLTARVAQLSPDAAPKVLAFEEDTRRGLYWLVTEDLGGLRFADRPTPESLACTAQILADLQIAALPSVADIEAIGIPLVTCDRWEGIGLSLLDRAPEARRFAATIPMDTLEGIIWSTPDLAIDAAQAPTTLVHGDLHPGNIALAGRDGSRICLMDWGSAYLGPAFLGLEELLLPAARCLPLPEAAGRARAAYLRAWSPLLGRPGRLERPLLACRTLVRLQVLDSALRRALTGEEDEFAPVLVFRKVAEAWRSWRML